MVLPDDHLLGSVGVNLARREGGHGFEMRATSGGEAGRGKSGRDQGGRQGGWRAAERAEGGRQGGTRERKVECNREVLLQVFPMLLKSCPHIIVTKGQRPKYSYI